MSECIKILHVVPELGYGGAEKVVRNYYEHMDQRKYSFDFVTHGKLEDYHQDMILQGCSIFYFGTVGRVGIRGYKKQIEEQLSIKEYDIIHIHTGILTGVYAFLFQRCGAKRIIVHAHTAQSPNPRYEILMPIFRGLAVSFSDMLIACGKEAGRFCFGQAKFEFLPNGIDYNLYRNVSQETIVEMRKNLGISQEKYIIGHVGRFSAQKNHSFLVHIIHDYLRINKNTVFVLVGDGLDRQRIEKMVRDNGDSENVIFTGIRRDVEVLMKTFDLFLLPSLFEGLPVVGIEAQAAGLPCIFSDTIDESVGLLKNKCSFLSINQGTDCWIREINRMRFSIDKLDDKEIFEALQSKGYEITTAVNKLGKFYDDVMEKREIQQ